MRNSNSGFKYLAIIGLLLIAALLLWILDGRQDPIQGEEGAETATESESARIERGHTPSTQREPLRGGTAVVDPSEAQLRQDSIVTGTVVDSAGHPVPDAFVIAYWSEELRRTDRDGNFILDEPRNLNQASSGEPQYMFAGAALHLPQVRSFHAEERVDIALDQARLTEFEVLAKERPAGIPDAQICFLKRLGDHRDLAVRAGNRWVELDDYATKTDSKGLATVHDLFEVPSLWIRVSAHGFQTLLIRANTLDARAVWLERERELALRLIDVDGRPISNTPVWHPWHAVPMESDDQGWIQIPSSIQDSLWRLVILDPERPWVYWPEAGRSLPAMDSGDDLLITHRLLEGRIVLPKAASASNWECASVAANLGVAARYLPDPRIDPEALVWTALEDSGRFRLQEGWQGSETALMLRHKPSRRIVLASALEEAGPYELLVPRLHSARIHFTGLESVREPYAVRVEPVNARWKRPFLSLSGSELFVPLEAGKHGVELLVGHGPPVRVGEFEMPDSPFSYTCEVALRQHLEGRVLAGGEPVFPCKLTLRDEWGTRALYRTDCEGRFEMPIGTTRGAFLLVEPEAPWLTQPHDHKYLLDDHDDRFDLHLPASRLVLDADLVPAELRSQVRCRFEPERREGPHAVGSFDRKPFSPLSASVDRFETWASPGRLSFHYEAKGFSLRPREVKLESGRDSTVPLRLVEQGRLIISVTRAIGTHEFRVTAHARSVPDAMEPDELEIEDEIGSVVGYQREYSRDLLIGEWEIVFTTPIVSAENGETLLEVAGEALWVTIEAGRTSRIVIDKDEAGRPSLRWEFED